MHLALSKIILIIINDLCTIFLQRKLPKNICQVRTFHQLLHLKRSGIVGRQLMECSARKAALGVHIEGTQNSRSHRYFIHRLFFSTLRPMQICTDKMTIFADRNTQTAALALSLNTLPPRSTILQCHANNYL